MEIITRKLSIKDYDDIKDTMIESYNAIGDSYWKRNHIEKLLDIFPEGQLCVEVDGQVVAVALSIIVEYKKFGHNHTYEKITGNYSFSTHEPSGDVLYGIEIFVHPDFRSQRFGRRLYDERKILCETLNLRSIVLGGRIPNYHNYSSELTPRQYIDKVKSKEVEDPVLAFQLANDFHVVKVLNNYLVGDEESMEHAVLLEWNNIFYQPEHLGPKHIGDETIRLGLVQWQMRLFPDLDAFFEQMEFFIETVSDYNADFIVFPELFNTPLMAPYNHLPEPEALRLLAGHTDDIVHRVCEYAVKFNVNIISGSMPVVEDGDLFNIAFLCHRSGKIDSYKKIHITPNERKFYGLKGGSEVKVFETDCGRVGIQICYDVEFPEVSRLMGDMGVQILFVPFLTDTQNGYIRVKHCAQARAIENECYVAIAGCVGNLPKVSNMDIQYAQSAVFTPSDFAFPTNGIKSEATPNTEMMLIVDVDLNLLKELHHHGSVRIKKDRRRDLYELKLLSGGKEVKANPEVEPVKSETLK